MHAKRTLHQSLRTGMSADGRDDIINNEVKVTK